MQAIAIQQRYAAEVGIDECVQTPLVFNDPSFEYDARVRIFSRA